MFTQAWPEPIVSLARPPSVANSQPRGRKTQVGAAKKGRRESPRPPCQQRTSRRSDGPDRVDRGDCRATLRQATFSLCAEFYGNNYSAALRTEGATASDGVAWRGRNERSGCMRYSSALSRHLGPAPDKAIRAATGARLHAPESLCTGWREPPKIGQNFLRFSFILRGGT
jgi:hypothetical protein